MASRSGNVAPAEKWSVRMPEPGTLSASLSVTVSSRSTCLLGGLAVGLDHDRELDQAGRRHRLVLAMEERLARLQVLDRHGDLPLVGSIRGISRESSVGSPAIAEGGAQQQEEKFGGPGPGRMRVKVITFGMLDGSRAILNTRGIFPVSPAKSIRRRIGLFGVDEPCRAAWSARRSGPDRRGVVGAGMGRSCGPIGPSGGLPSRGRSRPGGPGRPAAWRAGRRRR